MDRFKDFLSDSLPVIPKDLIPAISLGLILLSVVLVLIFFIMCVIYINSRPKPKLITPLKRDDLKKKKEEENSVEKISENGVCEELPAISGRLGEILSQWGVFETGPITKMFFKVLETIRSSTYDLRWRYKLPCFMIVGPKGSGKTTLLNNLNFEHLSTEKSESDSLWKLFKEGAIFEFPSIDSSENKTKFWSFISELFVFIRPRRPLDGIIVTVPADLFISETSNIEKQAREMFDRIFQFQHDVNFKLPIYFIVTKADRIFGFQEFVHLLKENTKQQIFGWSCPYSLDIAFSPNWISEIFSTIDDGIRKAGFYFARKRNIDENLEKAMLFEAYFEKIKPTLTEYLLTMFRTHNPTDGMILRGVYFVGRQKEVEISPSGFVQISALTPGVNVDASLNHLHTDDLYFVQDLFKDKIFKEYNIAYPILKDAGGMTKKEYRNKLIFAGSALFFSVGWIWGNGNIRTDIRSYYHTMTSVKKSLLRIKYLEDTLKNAEDQTLINSQASALLQNMPVVKQGDFFSVFVPQSWFFRIGNSIRATTELVFDSVVVKAMYIDLNFNTKNILLGSNTTSKKNLNSKNDIFDVLNFESFKELSGFAEKIKNLKKISAEYNSMRNLEDSNNVVNLTESLFGDKFEITDAMRTHVPNKRIMPPKFNLEDFQTNIESSLKNIFDNFIRDTLDTTVEKVLQNVANDIDRLHEAGQNSRVNYSVQNLAKLYNKVELVEDIFQNKNFSWIKESTFCPTPEYQKILDELESAGVVSSECLRDLMHFADVSFNKYRNALSGYKSKLSGKLLDNQNPSEGFLQVKAELKSLLDLPFICIVPFGNFSKELPSDKMLIWDVKRLKELCGLIDKYNEFFETVPEGMRSEYFDIYKTVAKKCFYPTIKAMVGNAQISEDMPLGNSRVLFENSYKKQAANIRNVSISIPKIIKVLDEIISEENLEDFGFSNLIITQYLGLLEKIDALFNTEKPYSTNAALFDDWDGNGNPQFMKMNSQANIKQYLSAQFDRIKFLSKELAAPVVDLLTIPNIFEKIRDKKLINKWREIITNVNDYENNKPGNSIAALESFITENLSKVSLDSFDTQGEIKNISQNDSDYFLSKRSVVAKSLMNRADVVQYDKAASSYNKVNSIFNKKLANKFPFGDSSEDASLEDLEEFVNAYGLIDANVINILERNKDAKQINSQVFDFLKNTNKILPFLKACVAQSKSSDPNTCPVCFNVLLRPFPNMEAMTSAVIDRMFSINNVPVSDNTNGAFFFGNPVMALFGWVASANEKPNEDKAMGNLRIEGNLAAFTYTGQWALFRMIEEHKISKGVEYPNGVVLQFNVPVASRKDGTDMTEAKMVYKITPMMRNGDKLAPTVWPLFPTSCPSLYGKKSTAKERQSNFDSSDSAGKQQFASAADSGREQQAKSDRPSLDVDVSFDE
ncbi:MAG: hypothetical protein J5821_00920 [Alphaproteobacteria bacterium]|nr:hypothetical protein [Alphaproteobacteria bacterium]